MDDNSRKKAALPFSDLEILSQESVEFLESMYHTQSQISSSPSKIEEAYLKAIKGAMQLELSFQAAVKDARVAIRILGGDPSDAQSPFWDWTILELNHAAQLVQDLGQYGAVVTFPNTTPPRRRGPKPKVTAKKLEQAHTLLASGRYTVARVAMNIGVSVRTLQRYLKKTAI